MPNVPIYCAECGARGAVNKVTAALRCQCGSTDLGLDGIDNARTAAGGTGWGKPMPSLTRGWSDYEGPNPTPTSMPVRTNDNQVCPACNGSGYDLIDKTVCRECNGTGSIASRHPTSAPEQLTQDATSSGPASGGARWQGAPGDRTSRPDTRTASVSTSWTAPATGTQTQVSVTAGRPSKDPYATAEYHNMTTGPAEGRPLSPSNRYRPEHDYSSTPSGPYQMDQASCPGCGHAPTELRKDRNEDAWWHCPNCGPLANIDKRPDVNPYAPGADFTPDRSMKTSKLLGRNHKTGRLLTVLARIHESNSLDPAEAVSLARKTLALYGEDR